MTTHTIALGNNSNTFTVGDDDYLISGGDGSNTLTLGSGNDQLTLGNGNNTLTLGGGADVITAGTGNNTITTKGSGANTVRLTDGNNTITLGDGPSAIVAGNGLNTVTTGNGNDTVTLGDGFDQVTTGDGNSRIVVGNGAGDTVIVGTGANSITLGTGSADVVHAGSGGNTVFAFASTIAGDSIQGGLSSGNGARNKLVLATTGVINPAGVSGVETFQLASGSPNALTLSNANFARLPGAVITVLDGNGGDNIDASALAAANAVSVHAGVGADHLTGGAGNDFFYLGTGQASVDGGAGLNTALFGGQIASYAVSFGMGSVHVVTSTTNDTLVNVGQFVFSNGSYAAPTAASDPLVDYGYYYTTSPDVKAAGFDASAHYASNGRLEGRNPNAFFDTNYYLTQNPDVKAAGVNPLQHFETYGWKEGRQPSLLFSDAKYLAANPDVQAAGINPLVHYLEHGMSEGRMAFLTGPSAPADVLVNAAYYDKQLGATVLPTGIAAEQQAAAAYDQGGWTKGLNPNAFFNTNYYLAHNADVAAAHIDPLQHYETFGWKEHRDPSAVFSTDKYLAAYSDVKAAGIDPLVHFIQFGQAEGRTAFGA